MQSRSQDLRANSRHQKATFLHVLNVAIIEMLQDADRESGMRSICPSSLMWTLRCGFLHLYRAWLCAWYGAASLLLTVTVHFSRSKLAVLPHHDAVRKATKTSTSNPPPPFNTTTVSALIVPPS